MAALVLNVREVARTYEMFARGIESRAYLSSEALRRAEPAPPQTAADLEVAEHLREVRSHILALQATGGSSPDVINNLMQSIDQVESKVLPALGRDALCSIAIHIVLQPAFQIPDGLERLLTLAPLSDPPQLAKPAVWPVQTEGKPALTAAAE